MGSHHAGYGDQYRRVGYYKCKTLQRVMLPPDSGTTERHALGGLIDVYEAKSSQHKRRHGQLLGE